ncbi:MAG TPA: hypothetical protein PLY93_06740 [Turneriella sp.]|nr:hypothetical protein [Turneriella sp.]
MRAVNEIASFIDSPYSPGAIYSRLNKMIKNNQITFNQNFSIQITPVGYQNLFSYLDTEKHALSITGILYRVACVHIVDEDKINSLGKKRLLLSMINYNQDQIDPKNSSYSSMLKTWTQEFSICLTNIIQKLLTNK